MSHSIKDNRGKVCHDFYDLGVRDQTKFNLESPVSNRIPHSQRESQVLYLEKKETRE